MLPGCSQQQARPQIAYEVGLAYLAAYHEVEHLLNDEKRLQDKDIGIGNTLKAENEATLTNNSMRRVKLEHKDNVELMQACHVTAT